MNVVFYNQIDKLCADKGIRPSRLARDLGLSPNAPQRWKSGSVPKADTLQKIANYFDVSTDYLLNGDTGSTLNAMGNVSNSAVVQGNTGRDITVTYGADGKADDTTGFEAELVRIYRALDFKGKSALMAFAYEQEEKMKK